MILAYGWEDLDMLWKRRAEKLLDDDRIYELNQQWKSPKAMAVEETQMNLF